MTSDTGQSTTDSILNAILGIGTKIGEGYFSTQQRKAELEQNMALLDKTAEIARINGSGPNLQWLDIYRATAPGSNPIDVPMAVTPGQVQNKETLLLIGVGALALILLVFIIK